MNFIKEIYNQMLHIPVTRFLIGVTKIGLSLLFFYTIYNGTTVPHLTSIFQVIGLGFIGTILQLEKFCYGLAVLMTIGLVPVSIYYICDGGLNVLTWHIGPLASFDSNYHWIGLNSPRPKSQNNMGSGDIQKDYPNIGRIVEYSDALMNCQNREGAMETYASSRAIFNNFAHNPRMLEYMDANLNHMSRQGGLEWVSGFVKGHNNMNK